MCELCFPTRFRYCLQTTAFYLFSFANSVSQTCQPHLILSLRFSPFLSVPVASLALSLGEGKGSGDPATPISLETDEAASPSSLPSFPSSPPSLSSSPLMTSLCWPWRTERSATFYFCMLRRDWQGEGVFSSTLICVWACICVWCKYWCQKQRAERSPAPRTTREREQLCALRQTQKHADRPHNNSFLIWLLAVRLYFSSHSITAKHTLWMYCICSSLCPLSLPAPLSLPPWIISCFCLLASLHALLPVPSRHIGRRKRQFGSTKLPADHCYSSHCHSLWDFLLTRRACCDAGWDCVSRHNSLNLVLLAMQPSHENFSITHFSEWSHFRMV